MSAPFRIDSYGPSIALGEVCTCRARRDFSPDPHADSCPWLSTPWVWKPMRDGAGGSHWRNRPTALEAAVKAHRWSGGGCPAMRVVDERTGDVVWQINWPPIPGQPGTPLDQPGPDILPDWRHLVVEIIDAARAAGDDQADAVVAALIRSAPLTASAPVDTDVPTLF